MHASSAPMAGRDGGAGAYAGDISSKEAWERLSDGGNAVLVDVRTRAEWTFVGIPDLSGLSAEPVLVEWVSFPTMEPNGHFPALVKRAVGDDPDRPLLFICRSGGRSAEAAALMTAEGYRNCWNVADGFEGGLDAARHRGASGGWKAAGLPWVQS